MSHIKDTSGIPVQFRQYFKKHDMITPHVIFHIISSILWAGICSILIYTLINESNRRKPNSFFFVLLAFLSFPFIAFIYKLFNLYRIQLLNLKPNVPADFGVCFTPWSDLDESEKKHNVIGSTNLKCEKTQRDYIFYIGSEIQTKTYVIVYTIFTLTLLFYPLPSGIPFDRNNKFKKLLMKLTVIISLLLLSAPILMVNRWSGLYLETLYNNLLLITVDILMILIAFVIFKVSELPSKLK